MTALMIRGDRLPAALRKPAETEANSRAARRRLAIAALSEAALNNEPWDFPAPEDARTSLIPPTFESRRTLEEMLQKLGGHADLHPHLKGLVENRAADSLARDHEWDIRASQIILRGVRAFDELYLKGMLADEEQPPIHPILSLISAMYSIRRGGVGHNDRLASAMEQLVKGNLISAPEFEECGPFDDKLLAGLIQTVETYLSGTEASGSRAEILMKVLASQVTSIREYLPYSGL